MPPDSGDAVFRELARSRSEARLVVPLWWAARGDTAALRASARGIAAAAEAPPQPYMRNLLRYQAAGAEAYLALARHDTAEAIRRFQALPDSLCPWCYHQPLVLARVLAARGRDREAAVVLEREVLNPWDPHAVRWALERARVNERLANRERAIASYRFVADVWRHADPEFQPYVEEAKAALKRLGGERR
jgi:hypothetical protein